MSKANSTKQGKGLIEMYYGKLMTLWKEIDCRVPDPMKCSADITVYNETTQKTGYIYSWPI